ncbi:hypothetical protein Gotur_026630 [Gossypium turneri]
MHNIVMLSTFDFVVDKVRNKLSGWDVNKLLMNGEQVRRHMSSDGHCPRCDNVLETGGGLLRRMIELNLILMGLWLQVTLLLLLGVFRDFNANWLGGYSMRIGKESIFRIEARAMLEGLRIAWDMGFRQIELKCDNALLLELLLAGWHTDSRLVELRLVRQLLSRNWKVRIHHSPRSLNEMADHIEKDVVSG